MVSSRVIALRTLNYFRSMHLPSYVALRILLESTDESRFDEVLSGLIDQATLRKTSRMIHLKRYKAIEGSRYLYRDYFVPSPSEALADSFAIAALHSSGVLKRKADVYSYRPPPSDDYGRNFEHFASGYRQRNIEVSARIKATGGVAVVADLKSFYPSISGRRALELLLERLDRSSAPKRSVAIVQASAERALMKEEGGAGGLRVGAELSHALANVYLTKLDERMRTQFPGSYFRYVDDTVLVVQPSQVSAALSMMDEVLEGLKLKRNVDKDAVADAEEWEMFSQVGKAGLNGGDCLAHLKFRLKLFLARNPEGFDELSRRLDSNGIYLPLKQLRQGAFDRHWRDRVSDFFRQGWKVALRYRFDTIQGVVGAALACRAEILRLLQIELERGISGALSSVARRWRIQSARFSINRAIYFADDSVLGEIAIFTGAIPELKEIHAVANALIGNFEQLIFTPGPAVAAAAQLMSLRGLRPPSEVGALSLLAGDVISSDLEAHFALRGLGSFDLDAGVRSDDLRGLISFSRRDSAAVFGNRLGYGAEVSALARGRSFEQLADIASTRFSSQEDVVLDALSLSSAYMS